MSPLVSGILVEDIIPKKGGQCSFYLKLPKIKVFKEKIGSKFDTTFGCEEEIIMNIGNQISAIRKEQQLTQEQFRSLFHVTRQTVSNWENEKSYPDLQMLIDISNQFEISLDTLIKEDSKMVKTIDKERVLGKIKKEKSIIDFFTGAGTGIIVSCLLSPDSIRRTVVIIIGLVMIGIGWYKKTRYDNKVFRYMEEFKEDS